jgi:hypothetical protein
MPKTSLFSDEFIKKWEHIIDDVDITEVPLECIKKIVIKLSNRRQRTINIQNLRRQGLDMDQIETVMTESFLQHEDDIKDVDFIVDVIAVADIVQPKTDQLLKDM